MNMRHHHKSGQAIIFLMVVIVIGLFVVVWNFDLHRIITAKIRIRNAADAAAMAGARWQGVTLNMIGDLNLIQAAILAEEAENQDGAAEFIVPPEVDTLHELRNRLSFLGPLAAYSISQQAAFDNGIFRDPEIETDLRWMAEEIRTQVGQPPYDNAYYDYADLLDSLADLGAAVGSYTANFPNHPLTQERFYSGIAQAMGGLWSALDAYRYQLENYEDFQSWSKLDTEIPPFYMLDLKLREWVSRSAGDDSWPPRKPATAISTNWVEYQDYFDADRRNVFASRGADTEYVFSGIFPWMPDRDIQWHIFSGSWQRTWPKPRNGEDDLEDADGYRFPIWGSVKDQYNYLGAETGVSIDTPAYRGILASPSRETVDLTYRAKAMPFGYIEAQNQDSPPYYFGFVFPVFTDVRLIHSDLGDRQLPPGFFRHVLRHLEAYLEGGPEALNPECRYCRLLQAWDNLDREEGLRWLEEAEEMEDSPLAPNDDGSEYDGLSGGATRGS
jgi:hypothetical protein